jgi:hypothetical protein
MKRPTYRGQRGLARSFFRPLPRHQGHPALSENPGSDAKSCRYAGFRVGRASFWDAGPTAEANFEPRTISAKIGRSRRLGPDPGYFPVGTNFRATPLMQNRLPVGCGPSSKTCPKRPLRGKLEERNSKLEGRFKGTISNDEKRTLRRGRRERLAPPNSGPGDFLGTGRRLVVGPGEPDRRQKQHDSQDQAVHVR